MASVRDHGEPLVTAAEPTRVRAPGSTSTRCWRQALGAGHSLPPSWSMSTPGPSSTSSLAEARSVTNWLEARGERLRDGIAVAAIDPHAGYARAIRTALPEAIVVVDRFHLIKLANAAIDDACRRVQRETLGHRGRRDDPLCGIRRLLTRGFERLSEHQEERLLQFLALFWHMWKRSAGAKAGVLQIERQGNRRVFTLPTLERVGANLQWDRCPSGFGKWEDDQPWRHAFIDVLSLAYSLDADRGVSFAQHCVDLGLPATEMPLAVADDGSGAALGSQDREDLHGVQDRALGLRVGGLSHVTGEVVESPPHGPTVADRPGLGVGDNVRRRASVSGLGLASAKRGR